MKHFLRIIFISFFLIKQGICQAPSILWERSFGGTDDDEAKSVFADSLGNIFVFGYTLSTDGNVSMPLGCSDFWLLKIDPNGNLLYNKSIGSNGCEEGYSGQPTFDNGFILCGRASSNLLPGCHGWGIDVYIFKADSMGNMEWEYCYGSLGDEYGVKIKQTLDSGYVFLAKVTYNTGAVTGYYGSYDWWVNKIDKNGTSLWSRCLGGTGWDTPTSIVELSDRNILVTGSNGSSDGDVTCTSLDRTCRVVKLDSAGNFLWDRCYGGSTGSEMGYDIIESKNGGFYVAASTSSYDGDVIGHIAAVDIWVFEADSSGTILWSNCYGGFSEEEPASISKTSDGGLLISGRTTSQINHSMPFDFFVIKTDSIGNLQWQTNLGGNDWDEAFGAVETTDNNFVVAGFTKSNDFDVSFNHGRKDVWVVKLAAPVGIVDISNLVSALNCSLNDGNLELSFSTTKEEEVSISLVDITGRNVFSKKVNSSKGFNQFQFQVIASKSIYFLKIQTKAGVITKKIF